MTPFPYGEFEHEYNTIQLIGDWHFDQGMSHRQIIRRLHKEGILFRGRRWNQGTLSRLITREFPNRGYIGWRERRRKGGRG